MKVQAITLSAFIHATGANVGGEKAIIFPQGTGEDGKKILFPETDGTDFLIDFPI